MHKKAIRPEQVLKLLTTTTQRLKFKKRKIVNKNNEQQRLERISARLEKKILGGEGTEEDWERLDRLSSANLREAVWSMDE